MGARRRAERLRGRSPKFLANPIRNGCTQLNRTRAGSLVSEIEAQDGADGGERPCRTWTRDAESFANPSRMVASYRSPSLVPSFCIGRGGRRIGKDRRWRPRTLPGEVMSPEDLANYLGCGRTFAYQLLAEGSIESFKIGRLRRIRRSDVDRYIEERAGSADGK